MHGLIRLSLVGWSAGLGLFALVNAAETPRSAAVAPALALLQQQRPLVIAHRGYSALHPENTLPAFKAAVAAGADLVELDYHHTADAVPIVLHDFTLDRTTDAVARWGGAKLPVNTRSAAELSTLDAGRWFDPPIAGVRLPSLVEAVHLIQQGSVTLIERKAGDAATCAALIRERGWLNQVVVQAFDWDYLRDYHRIEPDQVLGALGPPSTWDGKKLDDTAKALSETWLDRIRPTGARIVVWNRMVDTRSIEAARRRGLNVWVYTINEGPLANDLLDAGASGIITDNPALLWKTLALRGQRR